MSGKPCVGNLAATITAVALVGTVIAGCAREDSLTKLVGQYEVQCKKCDIRACQLFLLAVPAASTGLSPHDVQLLHAMAQDIVRQAHAQCGY